MNEEKLKIVEKKKLIKKAIKNIGIDTLREALFKQFEFECKLNTCLSSLAPQVIISSLNRFEEKLKFYQQIEKDLPNDLISPGDSYLLSRKLDSLKHNLAILYDGGKESEIIKEHYNEIKDLLGNHPSFDDVNSFICKQSFWGLLSYGIIRWPWMNKMIFAHAWAEHLCLADAINQIEELKNASTIDQGKEKMRKAVEVIDLLKRLFPFLYQNKIVSILNDFKKYIAEISEKLLSLEKNMNSYLAKQTHLSSTASSNGFFENTEKMIPLPATKLT